MPGESRILVAVQDRPKAVYVKPTGPCKMTMCPALRQFVDREAATDESEVYFDLSDADSVDSTFTGFLLSLAKRMGGAGRQALHLFQPTEKVQEAFASMHVLQFFKVHTDRLNPPVKWRILHTEAVSAGRAAEEVVDAHERLIEADERNAAEFEKVVDMFKAERNRKKMPES